MVEEPYWAKELKGQDIFMVFGMLSAPSHKAARDQHRQHFKEMAKYLQNKGHKKHIFALTFLMGKTSNKTLQNELEEEDQMHQDFLWVNIEDNYKNIVFKNLAFFNWVLSKQAMKENNPNMGFTTTWIVRLDDDHVFNTEELLKYFLDQDPNRNAIFCYRVLHHIMAEKGIGQDYPKS